MPTRAVIVLGVILGAIVLVGGYMWNQSLSRKDCEKRATVAATDTYPINKYPDTRERGRLQAMYKQTYMESCN